MFKIVSFSSGSCNNSCHNNWWYCLSSDAAHTIHPLAGLGVNLGFADVITLTEILKTAVAMGADIGKSQDIYCYPIYQFATGGSHMILDYVIIIYWIEWMMATY